MGPYSTNPVQNCYKILCKTALFGPLLVQYVAFVLNHAHAWANLAHFGTHSPQLCPICRDPGIMSHCRPRRGKCVVIVVIWLRNLYPNNSHFGQWWLITQRWSSHTQEWVSMLAMPNPMSYLRCTGVCPSATCRST